MTSNLQLGNGDPSGAEMSNTALEALRNATINVVSDDPALLDRQKEVQAALIKFDKLVADGMVEVREWYLDRTVFPTDESVLAFVRHQIECGRGGPIEEDMIAITVMMHAEGYFFIEKRDASDRGNAFQLHVRDAYFPPKSGDR